MPERAARQARPGAALPWRWPFGSRARMALAERAARLLHERQTAAAEPLLRTLLKARPDRSTAQAWLLASNLWARDPAAQLAHLNAFLSGWGLPPLALVDAAQPASPLNLRAASAVQDRSGGPLVSVLMTTHDSALRVEAAARSVLAQSWQALELIVVDDASTDDTPARVAALASQDSRVRLHRLPRNLGPYGAKHIGLQLARGEFVTCHDSDDWSHPLKLERQLAPLLARPQLVCTSSCWVRMDDAGLYHARQVWPLMRWNPSSPLFRRKRVLTGAGAWDVVRTGADSEFLERLRSVFGDDALLRIGEPLALGSQRPGSLMTAADTGYDAQGESPDRHAYMAAWRQWHADCRQANAPATLPAHPLRAAWQRPFAVPPALQVDLDALSEGLQHVRAQVEGGSSPRNTRTYAARSSAIAGLPQLDRLLESTVVHRTGRDHEADAVLAWGRKPSARRAQAWARRHALPLLQIEDGFLRSFQPGRDWPGLSLVRDDLGIYYDGTRPSALEALLESGEDLLAGIAPEVSRARELIARHGLSKYNNAAPWQPTIPKPGARVLVVDQTAGDHSISLGGARAHTFSAMLDAARRENPGATVYVKTHPETSAGRKGGHLTQVQPDAGTVVLREPSNPASLIEHMDRIYVVTSTMGFEALLAGKPVTCFGMPWYAGWGVTDDRQACPRRTRRRTVDELFAAAYLHYTRYLNPETHERGTIFDVIGWLVRQKAMADRLYAPDRRRKIIGVGYRRWKAANLQPVLSLEPKNVTFVADANAAQALQPAAGDWLVHWGAVAPAGLAELAARTGAECIRMEDGFIRSVGLGSDLIRPRSIALDRSGIYFDATRPSDLETMLQEAAFSEDELRQAREAREYIVAQGLTKYNLEPRATPDWPGSAGRRVVLVPGQVEDDASIRLGCTTVRSNLALLQAVRAARPEAYIVYKPHPDVASGNRVGRLALSQARGFADHVETQVSVVSCIEACDELHTMTSLSGFDALLRGKHVVTYGQPFYAGWGLTEDRAENATAFARRTRRLTLDELVAGALVRYPIYWDWTLKGYTSCMAVLRQIAAERDALEASGGLEKLRTGWWRRQGRKLRILWSAWTERP